MITAMTSSANISSWWILLQGVSYITRLEKHSLNFEENKVNTRTKDIKLHFLRNTLHSLSTIKPLYVLMEINMVEGESDKHLIAPLVRCLPLCLTLLNGT